MMKGKIQKNKSKFLKFFVLIFMAFCLSFAALAGVLNFHSNSVSKATSIYGEPETYIYPYLDADYSAIESSYDLRNTYPIYSQNQTSSELCWIYAPMKALETSLMIGTHEYYNFSETATAIFAYLSSGSPSAKINRPISDSELGKFDEVSANYGLVYESQFSNDNYYLVDENNVNLIKDNLVSLADKNVFNLVKPIKFSDAEYYLMSTLDQKQNIIKLFIKDHGGIAAAVEPGTIYNNNVNYVYVNSTSYDTDDGRVFLNGHMMCIVGWDDNFEVSNTEKGAWIAVNSWGQESYQEMCYIPYSYEFSYSRLFGYVYVGTDKIELESSSAKVFSKSVLGADSTSLIKNIFWYGEDLTLAYNVDESLTNFGILSTKIIKGTEDVTNYKIGNQFIFEISITEPISGLPGMITIAAGDLTQNLQFDGEYVIEFYYGSEVIETKQFVIWNGLETSYVNIEKSTGVVSNANYGYSMLSGISAADISSCFYINSNSDSILNLYLQKYELDFNYDRTLNLVYFVRYYNEDGTTTNMPEFNNGTAGKGISAAKFTVNGLRFSDYAGKKVEIQLQVSTSYTLPNPTNPSLNVNYSFAKTYYVNFLVSTYTSNSVVDANAHSVIYMLDGGKNAYQNVTKIPNSETESSTFDSIKLFAPTKSGSTSLFDGWYLDAELTEPVTSLSLDLDRDLVLYAKWIDPTINYFNQTATVVQEEFVYGDEISLSVTFEGTEDLAQYSADRVSSRQVIKVNGTSFYDENLAKSFNFVFPILSVGNYEVVVETNITIDNSSSKTQTKTTLVSFLVVARPLSVTFSNQTLTYDGSYHKLTPNVSGYIGTTVPEIIATTDEFRNAGVYEYEVTGVNNINYYIDSSNSGTLTINKKDISITWIRTEFVYDNLPHSVTYQFSGLISGDAAPIITIEGNGKTDVGTYEIVVDNASFGSNNYNLVSGTSRTSLVIKPEALVIRVNDVTEPLKKDPIYRQTPTWTLVSGTVYNEENVETEQTLGLTIVTQGKDAEKSGRYPITATISNSNYSAEILNGTYTVTGNYVVHYILPDGTRYDEYLNDGETPKGIDSKTYSKPLFSYYVYSEDLNNFYGVDTTIIVEVKSYAWMIYAGVVLVAVVVIYFVMTRKQRRNKVS
ncbi:MAG: hypothetical protein IJ538_03785 [Clostridia bacterium]|nr:hypothetical protein [Clostridia bacterium]